MEGFTGVDSREWNSQVGIQLRLWFPLVRFIKRDLNMGDIVVDLKDCPGSDPETQKPV